MERCVLLVKSLFFRLFYIKENSTKVPVSYKSYSFNESAWSQELPLNLFLATLDTPFLPCRHPAESFPGSTSGTTWARVRSWRCSRS